MSHVLLFHHIRGLTTGVSAFADRLRAGGHEVTVPDLFDGQTFATIDEGMEHVRAIGQDVIAGAAIAIAEALPQDLVYAGFSMGGMPAQQLAQQRPGARGALLFHTAIPLGFFGDTWPDGVPLQIHIMEDDPFDDVPSARELVTDAAAELFTYPGDGHLFTDATSDDYDAAATDLVVQRSLAFLARLS